MELIVDYSFSNKSFLDVLVNDLLSNFSLGTIQCNQNFEWTKLPPDSDLTQIDFSQLEIELVEVGKLSIQFLENSLPRVYITELSSGDKDRLIDFFELKFIDLIVYGKVCEKIDSILQNVETPDSWRRKKKGSCQNTLI